MLEIVKVEGFLEFEQVKVDFKLLMFKVEFRLRSFHF